MTDHRPTSDELATTIKPLPQERWLDSECVDCGKRVDTDVGMCDECLDIHRERQVEERADLDRRLTEQVDVPDDLPGTAGGPGAE